jgi:hypothetical protein
MDNSASRYQICLDLCLSIFHLFNYGSVLCRGHDVRERLPHVPDKLDELVYRLLGARVSARNVLHAHRAVVCGVNVRRQQRG